MENGHLRHHASKHRFEGAGGIVIEGDLPSKVLTKEEVEELKANVKAHLDGVGPLELAMLTAMGPKDALQCFAGAIIFDAFEGDQEISQGLFALLKKFVEKKNALAGVDA